MCAARPQDKENEVWWETAHEPLYSPMARRMAKHGHEDNGGTTFVVGGGWRSSQGSPPSR